MIIVFGFPSLVRLSHSFPDPRNSRPCRRFSMQRSLSSENLVVVMLLLVVIVVLKLISKYFGECHLNLTMIEISLPLPNSSYSTKLHGNHELEDNDGEKSWNETSVVPGCDFEQVWRIFFTPRTSTNR